MRPYDRETILQGIDTKWAGKTVHFAREVDSTNLWIKRLFQEGAEEGTLAVAEFQSAGRGRLGRSWQSPEGTSVMMSLLLKPDLPPSCASMLTLVMGLSVAQAVEEMGICVTIKWPNDVVASRRKLCGILTEMAVDGEHIRYLVIGVGLNVNTRAFPKDVADKATSLYLETGRMTDRSAVPGRVMAAFERNYESFQRTRDLSLLKEEYQRLLANMNRPVRILDPRGEKDGIARGISPLGELLVELPGGELLAVNSGEVSVRGLYSYV
ncbi:MAG: biotin--[acetyl-CoA-carboxylase] ligase [Eubacteriales bacterium]|nr:biotin--[acetyl-CoA-carboxylase] ligase [Eubacteriales bacterium]